MSNIFRQVDEDLRKERILNIWKKYGIYIVTVIILVIGIFAGLQINQSLKIKKNEEIVENYLLATSEEITENTLVLLEDLEENENQFLSGMVKLRIANYYAREGKKESSKLKLNEIITSDKFSRIIRDQAIYLFMMLELNTVNNDELKLNIIDSDVDDSNFKYLYKELIAINALLMGEVDESKNLFSELINDPNVPNDIRIRSEKFLTLTK